MRELEREEKKVTKRVKEENTKATSRL